MTTSDEILRVVSAVESFLPIVAGLVRSLRGLIAGSEKKSVDELLTEADTNWQQVIASARKELGPPRAAP